jgi:hypothetical protein
MVWRQIAHVGSGAQTNWAKSSRGSRARSSRVQPDGAQVKISKHLHHLKEHGMVEAERQSTWMIYRLPEKPPRELSANLACMQDCTREDATFARDA